jgi:tRNA (cytidine/uridine-2'-O-)-methyltransferase
MIRLALYQPDIPQNAGSVFRLGACLGVPVALIEPAGFDASDRRLKRAGLDYLPYVTIERHACFAAFEAWRGAAGARLVLATTRADLAHTAFRFSPSDVILLGRESAGVPEEVHAAADARIAIPLRPGLRSLNVAVAAGMILGEALRQLDCFPALSGKNSQASTEGDASLS